MIRRHLQFLLSGPDVEPVEVLRRRWDPVMAARTPAHITLVYPEEFDDEPLLLTRTREAAAQAFAFSLTTRKIGCEAEGDGGVWLLMDDFTQCWSSLRAQIVVPSHRMLHALPHVTLVHPRTSREGRRALASVAGAAFAGTFTVDEIVHTETREAGMRVLNRFPLRAVTRVVGAILRRESHVLLCHRSQHRSSYPGVWDIPGGHVDNSETLRDALARELVEELGITANLSSSTPWTMHRLAETELSIFVLDQWTGEPRNCAPDEHEEIKWVSMVELSDVRLVHPLLQPLLRRALQRQSPEA